MLAFTFTALLTSFLFVLADPMPTAPGPGDIFNEGANCTFAWTGDSNTASTTWKTMNVELMSGNNLAMTHLTTVATGLDGTMSGTHSYPCPEVKPNSEIYFYQFSSPMSSALYWTARWTIADASGQTTPPANPTQPTGAAIPWGDGALVDPSQAVPPPIIGGSSANANASSSLSSASNSTSVSTSSTSSSSTSSLAVTAAVTTPTTSSVASSTSSGSAASSLSSATGTGGGPALVVDARAWQSVVALGAAALTFAVLL